MPALPVDLRTLLERYVRGPARLRESVRDLTPGGLTARLEGAGFTVRDHLLHLADAELVAAVNVRLALAEERAPLVAHDPEAWQRRLQYIWRSAEAALATFEQVRFGTGEILARLDAAAWARALAGPARPLSVRDLVAAAVDHVEEHATAIEAIRAGKAPAAR
jgi:hypothetical protein